MPAPYNYSGALINPVASFLGNLQVLQQMEAQEAAKRQAEQRQRIMQGLMQPGATAEDFAKASLALPEDRELFKQTWDLMDEGKRNAIFKGGAEAYMLAESGPDEAVARLEEYALGFENSGDPEAAKQFRDAAQIVKRNPKAAKATIGLMLSFADGERFEKVAQTTDATTFQKDFRFIKETFGDDAAAEFAQYGRGGVVSIPLGNGETYVGPASMAPGAGRWQQQGGQGAAASESAPEILQRAAGSKRITKAESDVIQQSLGPNGKAKYNEWLARNGIKVITRTGTAPDGRRVVQYEDGTIEYAD